MSWMKGMWREITLIELWLEPFHTKLLFFSFRGVYFWALLGVGALGRSRRPQQ